MDFIVSLPCIQKGNDAIWVVFAKFTKMAKIHSNEIHNDSFGLGLTIHQ